MHPVEVGEILTLRASINYTGKTSMVIGVRVDSENIQTGASHHCNSSYFTMVAKDTNGKNMAVPGLELNDKEDIRRFVRSIHQQEQRKNRDSNFQPESFIAREHIAKLKNHNVKITNDLV